MPESEEVKGSSHVKVVTHHHKVSLFMQPRLKSVYLDIFFIVVSRYVTKIKVYKRGRIYVYIICIMYMRVD